MLQFPTILPLISAIFVLGLGLIVFRNKRTKLNIIFTLFCLATAVWLFGTFMMFISETDAQAIFWDRFVYMGVVFMPLLVYHFSKIFSKIKKQKSLLIAGYIFSGLFLILSRTDYFVADLYKYSWGSHAQARLFHHVFLVFFVFYVFAAFLNIFKSYREPKSTLKRTQVKYVFIAFLTLALIGSLAFLPAYGINVYPFAYISGVVFAIIIAYAIIRYRLMDIRLVMKRSTVYLVSLLLAGSIGLGIIHWAPDMAILALIVSMVSFGFVKKGMDAIANRYFFASLYNYQRTLSEVSKKLTTIIDLKKLVNSVTNVIKKTLGLDKVEFIFKIKDGLLTRHLAKSGKPLLYEELEFRNLNKLKKSMENLGAYMCLPLVAKNKLEGIIVLGSKISRDAFSKEDIELLEVLANQTAIALENARLYSEVKDFKENLEKKVSAQTKDIKELLKAKSEFLNIASHQLRTPVSIIRGMLSMVQEGTLSKEEEQDFIRKSYQSVNRLTVIIKDILDAQTIAGGKIRISRAPTQISDLVNEAVNMLQLTAQEKDIVLKYDEPAEKLPRIFIDRDRMRGVLDDLIDNALRYTPKGSVIVSTALDKEKKQMIIKIQDTGIGLVKEDMAVLFGKFARGTGGKTINVNSSGLGLYIVKHIVEAHNGTITAESKGKNKGSAFTIKLPMEVEA